MFLLQNKVVQLLAASLLAISTLHFFKAHQSNHRFLNQQTSRSLQISTHRGFGTHYVTVYIGNPAQAVRLVVSTGSDLTALPCIGCDGIDSYVDEPYNYTRSGGDLHECPNHCLFPLSQCQDAESGQCAVKVQYDPFDEVKGGYKGVEISTQVYVDTGHVPVSVIDTTLDTVAKNYGFRLDFVCQEKVLGPDRTLLGDGILGMSSSPTSFIQQMYNAGEIDQRMFSLCFRDLLEYQPRGVSAGQLTLGGYDPSHFHTPLVWAKNTAKIQHLSSYAVHVRRIFLGLGGGNVALERASQGTMSILPIEMELVPIDSTEVQGPLSNVDYSGLNGENGVVLIQTNSPTTYLHKTVEEPFKKAFRSITGVDYKDDMKIGQDQFEMLPTIFLQLEAHNPQQGGVSDNMPGFAGRHDHAHPFDVLLAVPPSNYLIYDGVTATPTLVFGDTSWLGANFLQQHEIVFDLDHDRIGIAERRDCPEGLSLIKPAPNVASQIYGPDPITEHGVEIEMAQENTTFPDILNYTNLQGQPVDQHESSPPVETMARDGGSFKVDPTNFTLVEGHVGAAATSGLPEVNNNGYESRIHRFGPATVSSAQALGAFHENGSRTNYYSILGFFLFFLGFALTAVGTQDRKKLSIRHRRDKVDHRLFQDDDYLETTIQRPKKHASLSKAGSVGAFFKRGFSRRLSFETHTSTSIASESTPWSLPDGSQTLSIESPTTNRSFKLRMMGQSTSSGDKHDVNPRPYYKTTGPSQTSERTLSTIGSSSTSFPPSSQGESEESLGMPGGQPEYYRKAYYKATGSSTTLGSSAPSSRSLLSSQQGASTQSFGTEQAIPAMYATAVGNRQYYKTMGSSQASARSLPSSGPSARSLYSASQAESARTIDTEKGIPAMYAASRSTRTDSSSTRRPRASMDDSASIDDHDYYENSASRLYLEPAPSQNDDDEESQSSYISEYATKPKFSGRYDDSSDEDSDPKSKTYEKEGKKDSGYSTDGSAEEDNYDSGNDADEAYYSNKGIADDESSYHSEYTYASFYEDDESVVLPVPELPRRHLTTIQDDEDDHETASTDSPGTRKEPSSHTTRTKTTLASTQSGTTPEESSMGESFYDDSVATFAHD